MHIYSCCFFNQCEQNSEKAMERQNNFLKIKVGVAFVFREEMGANEFFLISITEMVSRCLKCRNEAW